MTREQAVQFLIERVPTMLAEAGFGRKLAFNTGEIAAQSGPDWGEPSEIDSKVSVLANRMFLQIFSVPSLQAHLADAAVIPTGAEDGSVKIQLDFMQLPKEVLPDLERLLSTDYFKDHKLVKYIKNGQARTGLEIEVTPKELPGDPFDYAF